MYEKVAQKKKKLKLCIDQWWQLKKMWCTSKQQIVSTGVSETWEGGVGSMYVTCCT